MNAYSVYRLPDFTSRKRHLKRPDLTMSATAPPSNGTDARDPSGFLSEIIGAPVTVKLNSGVVYKGSFRNIHRSWQSRANDGR